MSRNTFLGFLLILSIAGVVHAQIGTLFSSLYVYRHMHLFIHLFVSFILFLYARVAIDGDRDYNSSDTVVD